MLHGLEPRGREWRSDCGLDSIHEVTSLDFCPGGKNNGPNPRSFPGNPLLLNQKWSFDISARASLGLAPWPAFRKFGARALP
eukprot:3140172-Prymnesium_polylepis.1